MNIVAILFEDFETLDIFDPVEIFGRLPHLFQIKFYSLLGGVINNQHGVSILTNAMNEIKEENIDILLIPGGQGTRTQVNHHHFITLIKKLALQSQYVLTVCTGSALLSKTGLLNCQHATSNKRAFEWVISCNPLVKWDRNARWVVDNKFYTSSGVSAGMDMILGFIGDLYGFDLSEKIADDIEYIWNKNKDADVFVAQS